MTLNINVEQLSSFLGAVFHGNKDKKINGIATLEKAKSSELSFLSNPRYKKYLPGCKAGAILLRPSDASEYSGNILVVLDPYLAYARVSHLFDKKPKYAVGVVHPSSLISNNASVSSTASIGAFTVIERGAKISPHVTIGPHCYIGANCHIGEGGYLAPRVTLYHDVKIGKRVIVQSGAVIGSEGFGFANDKGKWHKIAQIGGVLIGNDVEIGSNTVIDRGALTNTTIGNGVKLDNQIQIAHNVEIGDHTAIAACVGISGSTKIGKYCMLAGGVGLVGHINICDNVTFTGMTMVTHSISEPGVYSSGTAIQPSPEWRKSAARLRQLDDIAKRLRKLEKYIEK